jgi:hypothetical protein
LEYSLPLSNFKFIKTEDVVAVWFLTAPEDEEVAKMKCVLEIAQFWE